MAEPHELRARAAALVALADDVAPVAVASRARAAQPVWQCAHADQVRDALDHQHRAAGRAAQKLREHAQGLRAQADAIDAQREAQRREQQRRDEQVRRDRQEPGRRAPGP